MTLPTWFARAWAPNESHDCTIHISITIHITTYLHVTAFVMVMSSIVWHGDAARQCRIGGMHQTQQSYVGP